MRWLRVRVAGTALRFRRKRTVSVIFGGGAGADLRATLLSPALRLKLEHTGALRRLRAQLRADVTHALSTDEARSSS